MVTQSQTNSRFTLFHKRQAVANLRSGSSIMESETTAKSDEFNKTSADEEEESTTGYVADLSLHATTQDELDKIESKQNSATGDTEDENVIAKKALLQGSFGIDPRSSASAIVACRGNTGFGDEAKEAHYGQQPPSPASSQEPTDNFVNHGLAAWEESRQKWLERSDGNNVKSAKHAISLNVDEIIDAIFSSPQKLRLNGEISERFPVAVPLPQLVDILQDLWEAESL